MHTYVHYYTHLSQNQSSEKRGRVTRDAEKKRIHIAQKSTYYACFSTIMIPEMESCEISDVSKYL